MLREHLDQKFKDPDDPFRIVFVCAMWMTGFDVPCCSTIYLDKPMRNHTLMQTIARANRVFPDKVNGLIVDYVGVFRDLQRALAIYGSGLGGLAKEGEMPVQAKAELVQRLEGALKEATSFCSERGVNLDEIPDATGFGRVKLVDDAVEAIIANDDSKRLFLALANQVTRLYKAILPDARANEFAPRCVVLHVLAEKVRSLTPEADISDVMEAVEGLLNQSVAPTGYVIGGPEGKYGDGQLVDLSQIDFEALRKRFDKGRKRTEAEKLRSVLLRQVTQMVRLNRMRMDYLQKLQQMIDEYNAGSLNVEEFFRRLVEFTKALNEEQKRGIAEGLSEEELAVFDLLTRPDMQLTKRQEKRAKKVAKDLLQKLKDEKLVLDWRKKQQSRAAVRLCIEEILDRLPKVFAPQVYRRKCEAIYQHIYESYFGVGKSVYATAG